MTRRDEPADMAPLADALEMMLPFAMAESRGCTPAQLETRASRAATALGTYGDSLQYGGRETRQKLSPAALAVGALAEGVAAAELLSPGGGRELLRKLNPQGVGLARRPVRVDDGRKWWEPLAELEALLGIDPPQPSTGGAPAVAVGDEQSAAPRRTIETVSLPLLADQIDLFEVAP